MTPAPSDIEPERPSAAGAARPAYLKSRLLLSRLGAIPLALIVFVSESRWESVPVLEALFFGAGCILVGISTIGRLWCSLYISGYKSRALIVHGPYSLSRNPLYLFSLFGALGVGLTTETLLIPAFLGAIFALYYPAVMQSEEEKLLKLHGEEYAAYVRRVPGFFPRTLKVAEPDGYTVNPRAFRKSMMDALWFVWLVGIVEFAEALREAGIFPVLFRLY